VRDDLPSIAMSVDRGEDQCCGLSNGWNCGDG
jgi:hypothetical protein